MRLKVWLVAILVILCNSTVARSCQEFVDDIPKSEVYDCVTELVSNREKFQKFGVLVQIHQINDSLKHPDYSGTLFEDFTIFEDFKRRKIRVDRFKFPMFDQDMNVISSWQTKFEDGGLVKFFYGTVRSDESSEKSYARNFPRFDLWMLPITEISVQEHRNNIGSMYWAELLDEDRFLWAQANDSYIRGEWSLGDGKNKCYAQIYFDRKLKGLPVLARFIHPSDYQIKFAKKGLSFLTEVETEWKPNADGYVPTSIRVYRQNYGKNGKVESSTIRDSRFKWKSSFVNSDGGFHEKLFVPGAIDSVTLFESFK